MYKFYQITVSFKKLILSLNCMKICYLFIIYYLFFINCNFVLDVMYITTHLHVVKDFWNFKNMFNRFLIFKIFKFQNFQIMFFFSVDN